MIAIRCSSFRIDCWFKSQLIELLLILLTLCLLLLVLVFKFLFTSRKEEVVVVVEESFSTSGCLDDVNTGHVSLLLLKLVLSKRFFDFDLEETSLSTIKLIADWLSNSLRSRLFLANSLLQASLLLLLVSLLVLQLLLFSGVASITTDSTIWDSLLASFTHVLVEDKFLSTRLIDEI